MHPYQISSLFKQRRKHESIRLNYGSLYSVVDALHRDGLIVPHETVREGRRPERTVYARTPAGEAELFRWLRELIATPAKEFPQYAAGLSLLPRLGREEAGRLLTERAGRLRLAHHRDHQRRRGRRRAERDRRGLRRLERPAGRSLGGRSTRLLLGCPRRRPEQSGRVRHDRAAAVVGGADAQGHDIAETSVRDRQVINPLILIVVLATLGLLLRAIVAPVILIATVILSFAASLGVTTLVSEHIFGFAAMEGSIPLLGFVFLVALGIDYNIFLMSRVHEESDAARHAPGHAEGAGGHRRGDHLGRRGACGDLRGAGRAAAGLDDWARLLGRVRRAARYADRALGAGAGTHLRAGRPHLVAQLPCAPQRAGFGRCP
jgi:DNA-binding PadR family transcriptional regulator